jgi:hypothetical protein
MIDEERQRFARRLRERDAEIERLREEGTVELAKALLEIERLRKALAWYADFERWRGHGMQDAETIHDCGEIARAALKPKPDLRTLLPELAVIRQVMKDTKP